MEVNEGFVVYLFCKFHEDLGFDKILHLGSMFPDCIAEKHGKEVSIEFETRPYFLRHHLQVAEYVPNVYKIIENKDAYIVTYRQNLSDEIRNEWEVSYPISKFKIKKWSNGMTTVLKRRLDCDYCVCWKHKSRLIEELRGVEIIELSKIPFVAKFLKDKDYEV